MLHSLKVPLNRGLVSSLRGEASTGGGGGIPINPFDAYYNVIGSTVYAGLTAPAGNMFDVEYSTAGSSLYAGMLAPVAGEHWSVSQPDSTWGIVPMGNAIADVDANLKAELNNNFPSSAPWRGTGGIGQIVLAWCGWHADTLRSALHSVFNGGHQDYGGNEHIKVDLTSNSPSYVLVRPPSGSKNATYPTGFITNDGQENSGVYADGLPRAIHSYNKNLFVPDLGLVTVVQGNTYASAAGGTDKSIVVNPDTGAIEYFGGGPWAGNGSSGLGSCYDSLRRTIWTKGVGTGKFLRRDIDDFPNQPWVTVGANSIVESSESGMDYSQDADLILLVRNNAVYAVNPSNAAWVNITSGIQGTLVGAVFSGKMQPRYIGGNKFAVWDNSTDTTVINILAHSGDPYIASNWTISQLPIAPENTVVPTARAANGTYGRFAYFPQMRIFTLMNAANQPLYFYKLAGA